MISKKILVMDDDPLVLRTLSTILSHHGYTARTASCAEKALEAAESESFDLVLSDIRMPHINGVSAVQRIRDTHQNRNDFCSVVYLTGFADESNPMRAERMVSVADLMMKPFDPGQLIEAIEDEFELMAQKKQAANRLHHAA